MSEDDHPDTLWMRDALCLEIGNEIFFPEIRRGGQTRELRKKTRDAKQLCSKCDVKVSCLEYALSFPAIQDFGIWGGTTPQERDAMRETRPRRWTGTRRER